MKENFTLPISWAGASGEPSDKSQPVRILLVEDDSEVRRGMSKMLSSAGYEVDDAEDGAFAWDTLQSNSYDLMITDNSMPRVSGVELLGKVKTAHMELPVIMVTSLSPEHEFARKPWLKPDALVLKPVVTKELLEKVLSVLGLVKIKPTTNLHGPVLVGAA
ncbi:MAG TPA: response regulator [Verrucomicrobiae bacterium]|jgi:DNA-binding response OmpR family regulator|nr:response regulator [Verrucomicrobiae bacterium]